VTHRYEDFVRQFTPSPWMARAACRNTDPNVFFPTPGQNATLALTVCAGCPVTTECAELGAHEQFGVWGGVTRRGRRDATHGTVATYNNGCRCDPCTEAKRTINAARNRKKVA
jgi:WhiB family redox-sensing transcriptional regulator